MSSLFPVRFTFGLSVLSEIPLRHIEYYLSFFSGFLKKKYSLHPPLSGKFMTTPIDENSAQFADELLREFRRTVSEILGVIKNSTFVQTGDIVVIDLRGIIKLLSTLHLANELATILGNEGKRNKCTRFALIVDSIEENDKILRPLSRYIESKKVLVIDTKRRCMFGSLAPQINEEFSFAQLITEPIDRIKHKLIRKIGHFKRIDKEKRVACNQFFYDGSYCIGDIRDLIVDKLQQLRTSQGFDPKILIYHSPESPWLAETVYKVHAELSRLKKDYRIKYSKSVSILEMKGENKSKIDIFFLVDLIHSGDTFKGMYRRLTKAYPNARIRSFSFLNSGLDINSSQTMKARSFEINGLGKVEIEFALTVEQQNYPVGLQNCPMCKYDLLPMVDSSYIGADTLLSYEMWLMCDSAGYKSEDFQPDEERQSVDNMPHSLKLMEANAPYLSYKFDNLIIKKMLKKSPELMLVFPDETSNALEIMKRNGGAIQKLETPSWYFAECLRQLKEYQYFAIPRKLIREVKRNEIQLHEIPIKYSEFYENLRKLPEDIIVFDEISISGGTARTINKILDTVDRRPLAYFPIFNFVPSGVNDKTFGGIKVLTLYEFDSKPTGANA